MTEREPAREGPGVCMLFQSHLRLHRVLHLPQNLFFFFFKPLTALDTNLIENYEPRKMHRRTSAKYYLQFQGIHGPPPGCILRTQVRKTCFQLTLLLDTNFYTKNRGGGDSLPAHCFSLTFSSCMYTHILNFLQ